MTQTKCSNSCRSRSFFFFQAEDGIRDLTVTGVQTCALPISPRRGPTWPWPLRRWPPKPRWAAVAFEFHSRLRLRPRVSSRLRKHLRPRESRSEEHTSELQSQSNLVCRLLLEKNNACGSP